MKKLLLICLISIQVFSLDIDDIKIMIDMDVLIAFPNEKRAHTIPKGMRPSKLMKVNYLNLNGMPIDSIPQWLPKMTNISRLELADTKLDMEDLKELKPLKELDILNLSGTNLFRWGKNLSEILSSFRLNELNLSNTGGETRDYDSIGSLSSLVKLDLSDNHIKEIDRLNLSIPKKLKILNLSGNNIETFNFSRDFVSLEVLDISNNKGPINFDDRWDNPFLLKKLKQGKFNKDVTLPKSIMKRLGIKSKWVYPSRTICKKYGGEVDDDYAKICRATSKSAKKICRASNARLPTINELRNELKKCGGILVASKSIMDYDSNERRIIKENENNRIYQSCYEAKKFTYFRGYWSVSGLNNKDEMWDFNFYNGMEGISDSKDYMNYVRCVKSKI